MTKLLRGLNMQFSDGAGSYLGMSYAIGGSRQSFFFSTFLRGFGRKFFLSRGGKEILI